MVLPGASFLEKSGTFTNGERRVQRVNAVVEPSRAPRATADRGGHHEPDGYTQLGLPPSWCWRSISRIVPFFKGITWENLGHNGAVARGRRWHRHPIPACETFKRGKGSSSSPSGWKQGGHQPTARLPLHHHHQPGLEHYNCGTMTRRTRNNDILTGDVLLMPDDAAANGLAEGDMVCVESPRGRWTSRRASPTRCGPASFQNVPRSRKSCWAIASDVRTARRYAPV